MGMVLQYRFMNGRTRARQERIPYRVVSIHKTRASVRPRMRQHGPVGWVSVGITDEYT